jgi:hypothetical protein
MNYHIQIYTRTINAQLNTQQLCNIDILPHYQLYIDTCTELRQAVSF